MNEATYNYIVYSWIAIALVIFPFVLKIEAPYGRHTKTNWGPLISNRTGWILMEFPACFLFAIFFLTGTGERPVITWILFILWMLHYTNRTLIFPFRIRTKGKKMPVAIVLMAFCFNLVNAFVNGYFLGTLAEGRDYSSVSLVNFRFITGFVLFSAGLIINWWADNSLIHLRKPGDKEYIIPRKGLFNLISCPNHFGEIIEWGGFFIMAWNLPALSFFVWTLINLVPRALQHHRWYRITFPDYPADRKALFPLIL